METSGLKHMNVFFLHVTVFLNDGDACSKAKRSMGAGCYAAPSGSIAVRMQECLIRQLL